MLLEDFHPNMNSNLLILTMMSIKVRKFFCKFVNNNLILICCFVAKLGNYKKFTGLKSYNKNLKTMIAIGGWNEGSKR